MRKVVVEGCFSLWGVMFSVVQYKSQNSALGINLLYTFSLARENVTKKVNSHNPTEARLDPVLD